MKKKIPTILSLCLICMMMSCGGTEKIFQKDATNWKEYGDASWNYSKNVLTANVNNGAGFVLTQKAYPTLS